MGGSWGRWIYFNIFWRLQKRNQPIMLETIATFIILGLLGLFVLFAGYIVFSEPEETEKKEIRIFR
ncbi:hypothetical protein AYM02_02520 [Coxiella burnetii]|nr:hypothetical protein AYM38_02490 [Coxiella burnetii]ARI66623.1 hypothetical protein B7L74_09635 [Coxiella burnetii]ATN70144.1 hypothetical protein AYM02_02520 [Coxiella burnetii]ATN72090.1 hypothetical protein AYM11_02435 [Coxiella burnetii]ATN75145.1 hypothetical protein AYM90_09325 [Coxiella burnetii]